ncbi:MAG: coiled coil domain-containing protein [Desulfobacterales bacterium]|nr:coiled coil domain-containing protein [Desulfobacterales bacterium]MCF8077870.1 coiled coil domain-containing protein [Desulfobacterales bacterium]
MNEKEAYRQKIEAQIDEWKAEMDKLNARAKKLDAEGRIEAESRIQDLKARQEAARAKLDELRRAGDAAWKDVKEGLDRAVSELGDAVRDAASKFSSKS